MYFKPLATGIMIYLGTPTSRSRYFDPSCIPVCFTVSINSALSSSRIMSVHISYTAGPYFNTPLTTETGAVMAAAAAITELLNIYLQK